MCCSDCGLVSDLDDQSSVTYSPSKNGTGFTSCAGKLRHTYFIWSQNTNSRLRLAIFIFFLTIYFIKHSETKEKKRVRQKSRSEACESNVWACERVEKVPRRVTHARGVCLGRSATQAKNIQKVRTDRSYICCNL